MNTPVLITPHTPPANAASSSTSDTLVDLLYQGFYMTFLLRNGRFPDSAGAFAHHVITFLDDFEHRARQQGYAPDDIGDAKYAFSALVDETVLGSRLLIRDEWERHPLQLRLFGDQLGGEQFFDRLEKARGEGSARLHVLEVFHLCLLLGFKGRYLIEGTEKLHYLTTQLGTQIAHLKGQVSGFAPHWAPPDNIHHTLHRRIPGWVLIPAVLGAGLIAYLGIHNHLADQTRQHLTRYTDIIDFDRKLPHLTITLP